MDYFYTESKNINGHNLLLLGDEYKHAIRVLRKQIGDKIFVTDGNDAMYETTLSIINKDNAVCNILAIHRKYNEPNIDITLAVSLLKNPARFDTLVEKTTELGVRQIIPLQCKYTIAKHEKPNRLEKISLTATKQCGRSWIPKVLPMQNFETLIKNSNHWNAKLIPHQIVKLEDNISAIKHSIENTNSVLITIGPEGGFSEEEINLAILNGFKPISLGKRRLRTETAAITVMSQFILY